ncbi:transcriptional regulator, TetR family [Methylobacterium sp. 4-46]|uniref:TetR/AcrR family transcriptional regulator n=1 Tax=unclassified Methylobacterium TaxID=2615210 RepID=UPI000152BEF3|nr:MULTISPECIES: TetR/AcrR family transcriptional regulator [Methylobacterium]ACA14996.1 transcriptional regulator, TetR family [Methylobacterium sp. 4-46]WFT80734.1 TetR/AcrR family transcriptional regulator [Methylobacterium nodulans]
MLADTLSDRIDPAEERRGRILDAAERCFVRGGFHRTTMQDVAAEVGMSPGNLYRYFPSKDAIVAGLAERDRGAVAVDFAGLPLGADLVGAFVGLARRHLADEPAEKAILCVEMWAEATRNPAMAAICRDFEREMRGMIAGILREAGGPAVDAEALTQIVMVMADGVIARRALIPDFDPGPVLDAMARLIEAALSGQFDPTGGPGPASARQDRP